MKLKKDWSLSYFLYYICQIGYWLVAFLFVIQTFNFIVSGFTGSKTAHFSEVSLIFHDENPVETTIGSENAIQIRPYSTRRGKAFISIPVENNLGLIVYYYCIEQVPNIILFVFLFYFARIMKNVAQGDIFAGKNSRLLFITGFILIGSSLLNFLFTMLPSPIIEGVALNDGNTIESVLFMKDYLVAGIFLIVLAYVFKEGTRIYEEQKLTV